MKTTCRSPHLSTALALLLSGGVSGGAVFATGEQSVILVVGAPGTPEYAAEFGRWAEEWIEAARRGGARIHRIGGQESDARSGDESDRERLAGILASEAKIDSEPLWLVFIGHGTFDGESAKFNLRGPDVSAGELAKWLEPCARPLAVINCASASGPFVNRLSAPRRVIVTATKSGFEYNYARFGGFLAGAMARQEIDIDRDGRVSLLEAFLTASARTAEFYEQESRLATEHALIDDNGDARGTPASWFRGIRVQRQPGEGARPDGARANQFVLVRGEAEQRMSAALRERRDELELAMEALRGTRAELGEETYYARLEAVALELARLYESAETPAPGSGEANESVERDTGPVSDDEARD